MTSEELRSDDQLWADAARTVLRYTGLKWGVADTASLLRHAISPIIDRQAEELREARRLLCNAIASMEGHPKYQGTAVWDEINAFLARTSRFDETGASE